MVSLRSSPDENYPCEDARGRICACAVWSKSARRLWNKVRYLTLCPIYCFSYDYLGQSARAPPRKMRMGAYTDSNSLAQSDLGHRCPLTESLDIVEFIDKGLFGKTSSAKSNLPHRSTRLLRRYLFARKGCLNIVTGSIIRKWSFWSQSMLFFLFSTKTVWYSIEVPLKSTHNIFGEKKKKKKKNHFVQCSALWQRGRNMHLIFVRIHTYIVKFRHDCQRILHSTRNRYSFTCIDIKGMHPFTQ